jgi:hypothetical protein
VAWSPVDVPDINSFSELMFTTGTVQEIFKDIYLQLETDSVLFIYDVSESRFIFINIVSF